MRTIENYWKDFEDFGFIKQSEEGRCDYVLTGDKGEGGFRILGDPSCSFATVSDCTLFQPFVVREYVDEKGLVIGQYYAGQASYYHKKEEALEFEYGLNAYVNAVKFYGYKRIEPNIRLVNIGFGFREKFFSSLPIPLPDDFWERAANALNPERIVIPKITAICNSLKDCALEGDALTLYIHGKSLEVFALLYDYIYAKKPNPSVHLSPKDKIVLKEVKEFIEVNYADPLTIAELSKKFAINQQKLVSGFKDCFHTTINHYTKKMRMTKALDLLYEDELSIVDIARAIGYYGDGYFQKAFKETYGISPSQMRKDILT